VLQAQKNLELAVQFNPDNAAVYYNQGWHCEDARDFICAREKYRRAALLGMAAAHSNLARLSILLDKDYDAAAALSQQGLRLVKDNKVKYALLKNLGWARLGQRRYTEAKVHLQSAIALRGNRAAAHCLLAQVLEAHSDLKGAQGQWETCRQYANVQNPDEDVWMGMAQQRLAVAGKEQ
jgi:Flp pilus assembly protein TadD